MHSQTVELLAPAGNLEKLKTAIHYGADAVYISGKAHSLRSHAGNFTTEEMRRAVRLAREKAVRVYVAVNAFLRPREMDAAAGFLRELKQIGPDAVIIADPGVLLLARELIPEIPVHLSTQANTMNHYSVRLWRSLGVTRINAARELSLSEIRAISEAGPVEVEAFVHGAMCIAYSGRCLLSSYMAQRHSNSGECAHPCRWRYAVVEELRPGKYMPVEEDGSGSYIFNSKDLCMISHLPQMLAAGVSALKIEGRQKGLGYLAAVVYAYRSAIDACCQSPQHYRAKSRWIQELTQVSPRPLSTGFYVNAPAGVAPDLENSGTTEGRRLAGLITGCPDSRHISVELRNKIRTGDTLDILSREKGPGLRTVIDMRDPAGVFLETAQAGTEVLISCDRLHHGQAGDIVRTMPSQGLPKNRQKTATTGTDDGNS